VVAEQWLVAGVQARIQGLPPLEQQLLPAAFFLAAASVRRSPANLGGEKGWVRSGRSWVRSWKGKGGDRAVDGVVIFHATGRWPRAEGAPSCE
jgi:hypothetical protein